MEEVETGRLAYARRAERMRASEIRELLKLLDQPDIISFAGGIPDPGLLPVDAARDAYAAVLAEAGRASLQYSVSEGYAPLREWITRHMARLGVRCDIGNIVITSGSQQGLDFLGKLLLSPGDTALVTAPTYLGALQAFNAYEPHYDTITPEGGNRSPQSYDTRARELGGQVKFAYVVPDFSNPTGETMSYAARRNLLDLTAALDVPVIEDAAYHALRFEGAELPPILAMEIEEVGDIDRARSIYCGTFSKTIAPGLRVGWVCAARDLIQKIVLAKQASDLHSASINQMVVHRLAERLYDQQVEKARAVYRERRDGLLAALKRHMPPGVTWTTPQGGMFLWLSFPPVIDGAALLAKAVAEAKVAFVPGGAFFATDSHPNSARLSYSLQPPDKAEEGMARLGALIKSQL